MNTIAKSVEHNFSLLIKKNDERKSNKLDDSFFRGISHLKPLPCYHRDSCRVQRTPLTDL